jgi:hypothetical protein
MSTSTYSQPDYSMVSRRSSGSKLFTSQIALEIARLVHAHARGEIDLERNEPLFATEEGDAWVVSGSKVVRYDANNSKLDGSIRMIISQFDGQILSYLLTFELPRDSEPPRTTKV